MGSTIKFIKQKKLSTISSSFHGYNLMQLILKHQFLKDEYELKGD